jgi:hypothetical protein
MSKNRGQSASRNLKRSNKLDGRDFNNKKGVQLVVTPFYDRFKKRTRFTKVYKVLQRFKGKTIVHYVSKVS